MTSTPKTALEMQIEQEKKELDAVPKVPISHFFGSHARCHVCGQLEKAEDLKPFDRNRKACRRCKGG